MTALPMKSYPPHHFVIIRVLFGLGLAGYFASVLPQAPEAFAGRLATVSSALDVAVGFNVHPSLPAPLAYGLSASLIALALLLAAGWGRKAIAPLLGLGWIASLADGQSLPLALIAVALSGFAALAILPSGEPGRIGPEPSKADWTYPSPLYATLWIVALAAYGLFALDLLGGQTNESPIRGIAAAALSLAFIPLSLFPRSRWLGWYAVVAALGSAWWLGVPGGLILAGALSHLLLFDPSWHAAQPEADRPRVVFFDGVCGFCNASVQVLIAIDRKQLLRFAPLQGDTARSALSPELIDNLDTLAYDDGRRVCIRSTALLSILRDLGGLWSWAYLAIVVPASWRDKAYAAFAARRYAWFGRLEACKLPSPAERNRFRP